MSLVFKNARLFINNYQIKLTTLDEFLPLISDLFSSFLSFAMMFNIHFSVLPCFSCQHVNVQFDLTILHLLIYHTNITLSCVMFSTCLELFLLSWLEMLFYICVFAAFFYLLWLSVYLSWPRFGTLLGKSDFAALQEHTIEMHRVCEQVDVREVFGVICF